ncbi:unnamed protein product [Mycena citricolor]|uniref:Uncharacterized protein n=1 Tax=Mycena citricolor TaxID=2018698 RepID=A0AAD2HQV8_9AGAR|nr:unnamed protein product [Mycena citricolor]
MMVRVKKLDISYFQPCTAEISTDLNWQQSAVKAQILTMSVLEIHVSILGYRETQCDVLIRKPIPANVANNLPLLDAFAQTSTMAIGFDMKHSQRWECEQCGKPASETWLDPRPTITPAQSLVTLYVRVAHLCPSCHAAVETGIRDRRAKAKSEAETSSPRIDGPSTAQIEVTPGGDSHPSSKPPAPRPMAAASTNCKLTRYCRQRTGRGTGRSICKTITEVKWLNWEDSSDPSYRMPGSFD